MFKFLKDKIKGAISKISDSLRREEPTREKAEEVIGAKGPEEIEPKETLSETKESAEIKEGIKEEIKEEIKEVSEEKKQAIEEKKENIFQKIKKSFAKKPKKTEDEITEREIEPEIKSDKIREKIEIKERIQKETGEKQKIGEKEEKKGFFKKIAENITTTKIDNEKFEKLFWELELALLENNVAVEVIEKIKSDLKNEIVEKPIKRGNIEETIEAALKNSVTNLFFDKKTNLLNEIKNKQEKPYIIVFFGINGSGKTTTIAKIAHMLKNNKMGCVIAAADTFRAASIEQLQHHGDNIGVKVIKHDYGSDPAAVAFDAIKHAKAKNADVVLIDTAGRMHSNKNLVDEMKKIVKIAKPDMRIFIGESITGNDCVEQAKTFNDAVGIDGIILSKVDIDEKGGAAVSVSYITKKPILYFGIGQDYGDLKYFEPEMVVGNLGLG